MPPKRVSKKLPTEQIPSNSESSSNHLLNAIRLQFDVNHDAELKQEYNTKRLVSKQNSCVLNALLDQEERKSKSKQQDGDLLLFKAQLKQLREKLVCFLVFINITF
jgi:hypothetical protein